MNEATKATPINPDAKAIMKTWGSIWLSGDVARSMAEMIEKYSYLKKFLNVTKQTLHKHVSLKMLSVHNGSFRSTDILAPSSQVVCLIFTENIVFWILNR